jgi:hypothetical protein
VRRAIGEVPCSFLHLFQGKLQREGRAPVRWEGKRCKCQWQFYSAHSDFLERHGGMMRNWAMIRFMNIFLQLWNPYLNSLYQEQDPYDTELA